MDSAQYQNQFNHFMKNLGLMGGMLLVMAFGAGPLSIDERRLR
jgi:putative oxidoreductase